MLLLGACVAYARAFGSEIAWHRLGIAGACLALGLVIWRANFTRRRIVLWVFATLFLEMSFHLPSSYPTRFAPEFRGYAQQLEAAKTFVPPAGKDVWELRDRSPMGDWLNAGVATIDNGAPAILPYRLKLLRRKLFRDAWDGALPIEDVRRPYGWSVGGVNLVTPTFNARSLGRAYLASTCQSAKDADAAVEALIDADSFREGKAIVENLDAEESEWCEKYRAPWVTVKIDRDYGSRVDIGSVRGPALLILSDLWYPGWKAVDTLSGQTLDIKPANGAFRALRLAEARDYRVSFRYRPPWFGWAWMITLVALLLWLGTYFCVRYAFQPRSLK